MSPLTKRLVFAIAVLGLIALLRFKPWQRVAGLGARETLTVGFLPVT